METKETVITFRHLLRYILDACYPSFRVHIPWPVVTKMGVELYKEGYSVQLDLIAFELITGEFEEKYPDKLLLTDDTYGIHTDYYGSEICVYQCKELVKEVADIHLDCEDKKEVYDIFHRNLSYLCLPPISSNKEMWLIKTLDGLLRLEKDRPQMVKPREDMDCMLEYGPNSTCITENHFNPDLYDLFKDVGKEMPNGTCCKVQLSLNVIRTE